MIPCYRSILATAITGVLVSGVAQGSALIASPFDAYAVDGQPVTAAFAGTRRLAVTGYNDFGEPVVDLYFLTSTGSFLRRGTVPLDAGVAAFAYADVNGDFEADLVMTRDDRLDVMVGMGSDTFDPPVSFATVGYAPGPLAVVDLDGDGLNEVLALSAGSGVLMVFPGDPDLVLGARADYPTGSSPTALAVGDLDGDGDPDVVVCRSGGLALFENEGAGGLAAGIPLATTAPIGAVVADLDGDSHADLAVARSGAVSILRGYGDFTFDDAGMVPTLAQTRRIRAADLDRDGLVDLVVGNDYGIALHDNLGGAAFAGPRTHPTGPAPVEMFIVDFEPDGVPDLVAISGVGKNLSLLKGNGDGTFGRHVALDAGGAVYDLAAGDLDGDGRADLVALTPSSVNVFVQDCCASFEPRHDTALTPWARAVAVGDLDQDGRDDLVVSPGSGLAVMLSDSDGHPGAAVTYLAGAEVLDVAIGDFDRDGWLDVLALEATSLSVLTGNGDGSLDPPVVSAGLGTAMTRLAVGDLDRDGFLDAVLADPNSAVVRTAMGAPGAAFNAGSGGLALGGYMPENLRLGDLDRDGILDLAVAAPCFVHTHCFDREVLVVARGSGTGGFTELPRVDVAGGAVDVAIADLDRDGFAEDLVVACSASNVVSVVHTTPVPARVDHGTDSGPRHLAVADVNHDGSPDIAVGAGAMITLLLNGQGVTAVAPPTSASRLDLARIAPNPARGPLSLTFRLPASGRATLGLYDLAGRSVRVLMDRAVEAGEHTVAWDGRDDAGKRLATGVYLVDLRVGDRRVTRKFVFNP